MKHQYCIITHARHIICDESPHVTRGNPKLDEGHVTSEGGNTTQMRPWQCRSGIMSPEFTRRPVCRPYSLDFKARVTSTHIRHMSCRSTEGTRIARWGVIIPLPSYHQPLLVFDTARYSRGVDRSLLRYTHDVLLSWMGPALLHPIDSSQLVFVTHILTPSRAETRFC